MSFDDYAEYMTQKYRLSTAIAILKTKPENLTTEEYLNELKNKINDKMNDDLDITICSDDFNLDDDDPMVTDDLMNISDTTLKDYNRENDDLFDVPDAGDDKRVDKSMLGCLQSSTHHIPENITQTTYYETQRINPNPIVTHYDHINPIIEQVIENNSTYYIDTIDIVNSIPRNIVGGPITTDSQKTILYTPYGYTQNTHFSPSQTNIIIPQGHIYGTNNNRNTSKGVETNVDVTNDIQNRRDVNNVNFPINDIPNMNDKDVNNANEGISIDSSGDGQSTRISNENVCGIQNTSKSLKYTPKSCHNINVEDVINDNEIRLTNVTNYSLDMNNQYVVNDNDRRSNELTSGNSQNTKLTANRNESKNILEITEHGQNSQYINIVSQNFDDFHTGNVFNESMCNKNNINLSDNTEFNININNSTKETLNAASNVDVTYSHNKQHDDDFINNSEINKTSEILPIETIFQKSQNKYTFSQNDEMFNNNNNTTLNAMNPTTHKRELNEEVNVNKQIIRLVEEDRTQEVIPFKILEEFNKVKIFLNRNERRASTDGYSTDSGYRSDSQGRKSALQLTGHRLNQSGHCLFNYIMSCHLVVATRDITIEIAQVLGQLVDRLHEEEKYPTFLEALLEANNVLLRQLHEGDNSIENVMLNRDENIQRLVLLNKSVHIQKYCIEKVTNILTDYHALLTDTESIFELSNIDRIENLHYLFHILEILLQKYNKNKDLLSQNSTQTSQDDSIFKKSSITDVWKRKWNPNYKDGGHVGSCEKTCVMQACCEILNKIIVDSLNSYSLVSYAALKCFNLMQS